MYISIYSRYLKENIHKKTLPYSKSQLDTLPQKYL